MKIRKTMGELSTIRNSYTSKKIREETKKKKWNNRKWHSKFVQLYYVYVFVRVEATMPICEQKMKRSQNEK